MRKKYNDLLNILITDYSPIRNRDFYGFFIKELIFLFLVFIVSIFLKGEMYKLSIFVIYFTIVHIAILLIAFLLFKIKSDSKLLQLIPTGSYFFFYLEFLFWASIFFDQSYLIVFFVFVLVSLIYQLVNFIYQIAIVSKVKHLEFELKNNMLQAPLIIISIVSAAIGVISLLLVLPPTYVIISLEGLNIGFLQAFLLNYSRVFTGWRKQSKNLIYTGRIK